MNTTETKMSHGVEVIPGKVAVSGFLKEAVEKTGGNRKFSGSFEDLENLTELHFDNWKPGIGSVDGDVRIVELPTEGFYTEIVQITPENQRQLEVVYNPRREGEEAVPTLILRGVKPAPASTVGIVIYRADVLAQDNDRSSKAEWEIVAILADPELPEGASVPMHPATMARNNAKLQGGTYREYTPEQWLEATLFWQRHARAVPALDPSPFMQVVDILVETGYKRELDVERQAAEISKTAERIEAAYKGAENSAVEVP